MFRYLAFVWNAENTAQRQVAKQLARRIEAASSPWLSVADCAGLRVFCAGVRCGSSEPYSLDAGRLGVIVGTLFERSPDMLAGAACRKAQVGTSEAHRIAATAGRELVASYWGRYVAFISDPQGGRVLVVRDPRGGLPCFSTVYHGVTIFFSQINDCIPFGTRFSVNWKYLTARVTVGAFHSEATGLNEVSQVSAGECITFHREQVIRSFYWHPQSIARSDVLEDPLQAAKALRATAKSCVHAWASCYEDILHRLSGGLDSSVVLGCLHDAPSRPRITCVNFFHPQSALTDERAYARLAAKRAGCELVERERCPEASNFEALLSATRTVIPLPHLAHIELGAMERQIAQERGVTAIFGGDGGDAQFCRHRKQLAVADYVRRHGLNRDAFRLAANVAPLVQMSVWRILADALRERLFGAVLVDNELGMVGERALVNMDVRAQVLREARYVHPWFRPAADTPSGKLLHTRLMLHADAMFYTPFGQADDPEEVHPLRSQPIVEVCLRIPTYVHADGGRDRGLARRAFAPDLPQEIVARYWKSRAAGIPKIALLEPRNNRIARELLLDGVLVHNRLLDRQSVEAVLGGRITKNSVHVLEIFDHLATEAWLRSWAEVKQQAVA